MDCRPTTYLTTSPTTTIFFIFHSDMRNGGLIDSWVGSFFILKISFVTRKWCVLNACIFFIISEQQWVETWGSRGLNFTTILHNFSVMWKLVKPFRRTTFCFQENFWNDYEKWCLNESIFITFGVIMKHGCLICHLSLEEFLALHIRYSFS